MSLPKKEVNVFIVSDATGLNRYLKDFLMLRQKNRLKTF